jgi:HD-GYP domain-containing protein (c-di-GMP phosphodiesterase class II)
MVAIKDFMNSLPTEGPTDRLRVKRIIQDLVDLCFDDNLLPVFLGLTSIKNYDEYSFHHSVNTAVLAIAFGRRLGLPKKKLLSLGLAGLFCDIGKAYLPAEILHKKEELSEDEWNKMKDHSVLAVKAFLLQRGLSEELIKRMIVAFEHHIDYNLASGYPVITERRDLNLFSRIITIVDNFDALTTAKEYRDAYMPDEALKIMYEQSGEKFDPVLLKVFMNMIGLYPIGAMVQLNSGEVGVVYHNSHDPRKFDRPKVKLVLDAQGNKVKSTQIIDLTAMRNGAFERTILRTVDPLKFNLNVPNLLLAQG